MTVRPLEADILDRAYHHHRGDCLEAKVREPVKTAVTLDNGRLRMRSVLFFRFMFDGDCLDCVSQETLDDYDISDGDKIDV